MLPVIELSKISKSFTERNWKTFLFRKSYPVQALEDVSLTVNKGEIMGLLGPNGAGKTTLIKILATLITPDRGSGTICGFDICRQSHRVREKIGLVSTNDRTFYWRLTGRDNLSFFASLYNLWGKDKMQQIEKVLDLTGMTDKADFRFMSYSAGQKQRLAIARAMLSEPEILLLDEATASLDPIAARSLLDLTRNTLAAKEQKTILWCTHNLTEADEICDRLTILHQGRILQSGTPAEIHNCLGYKQSYRLVVDSLHPSLQNQQDYQPILEKEQGAYACTLTIDHARVPELLKSLAGSGVGVYECSRIKRPLEAAFTELVLRKQKGS
ncbi:MAG: ABC transporter ATP-binding protein [Desulfocapsaceae bacterium]|nr:ABC transporter ATP-binding protein [Desulfocapsaceae bacterium]